MPLSALAVDWASVPSSTQAWPNRIGGFALSPFAADQDPRAGAQPSESALRADLALLAPRSAAIRTYSVDGIFARLPALAAAYDLQVTVGAPLGVDALQNRAQIRALRDISTAYANVPQVVLGNETLLESATTLDNLQRLLDHARRQIHVPLSTAEPWHIWLQHPSLAEHVDFLLVHFLPYWEGVDAAALIATRMARLRAAFPGKRIVIGEVGWPSDGRTRRNAVASRDVQARFLGRFLQHATQAGYEYFLLEAFDQPWKWRHEGAAGAHWGVFDARRVPKVDFATGAAIEDSSWWAWLSFNALFVLLLKILECGGLVMSRGGRLHRCASALLGASLIVVVMSQLLREYWDVSAIISAVFALCALLGVVAVLLYELHEWGEARWGVRSLPLLPSSIGQPIRAESAPMVSIHVPICNEPPQMVMSTLQALAALDYEHYEVVVVDNNTLDATLWRPIQQACEALGERFRFIHRDALSGFKAGALNLALSRTDPQAKLIGVVDADYQVDAHWLRDLVDYFVDPCTDIVQAPQDYRDGHLCPFKTFCVDEYSGFFHIGMVVRDRRNAIIQHGTMALVRRQALQRVGGWAEWSITEDAELGLRLLDNGGRARYVPVSYGQGLSADNFLDYKRQRFRWALGAVQILRAHASLLLGRQGGLSRGQRFHFVAGWLPWLADGAALVFAMLAFVATLLINLWPQWFDAPVVSLCAAPLVLFSMRVCKHVHLYWACVRVSAPRIIGAGVAGMALMPTAGLACLCGVLGIRRDFLRTPKLAKQHSMLGALASVCGEMTLFACLGAAATFSLPTEIFSALEIVIWRAMLLIMALPFASALILALVAVLPWRSSAQLGTLPAVAESPRKP